MCGICGEVGFENGDELVQRMNAAMRHRGPDSAGMVNSPPFALGVRRLRIIDLDTGDQPLFSEDRKISVIQNGEIYNFQVLREQLQREGHHFTTRSDSEVIVHAYEQWGLEFLARLKGMFVIALLDQRISGQEKLILGRDRLGIKPLYLWMDTNRLLFASEVRALLSSGIIPRRVSQAGLLSYLAFGSLQEPLSLVEDIFSLPPASWMMVQLVNGKLEFKTSRYWKPELGSSSEASPPEIRTWLDRAVRSHLVSDVPLGAFLSGGLDSGAIVALGSQALRESGLPGMQAFTLSFSRWPLDERRLAQATAEFTGSNQQIRLVEEAEFLADLPQALVAMDQPTADGVNSWFVSREARRAGLTVALSGIGGDELFGGYPGFRQAPILGRFRSMPYSRLAFRISRVGWLKSPDRLRKLEAYLSDDPFYPHPLFAIRGLFTRAQIQDLVGKDFLNRVLSESDYEAWRRAVQEDIELAARFDSIAEISWLELSHYMCSTLLRDTDMMSMAHSLEVRVPFLDSDLVEQVLNLPGAQKFEQGRSKPLLAKALQEDLPPEVLKGEKRTFTFPFEKWLQEGLREEVGQRLTKPVSLGKWFNQQALEQTWYDFSAGRLGWARPWSLYVLDKWLELNL